MAVCRVCSVELEAGINWPPSRVKTNSRICKICQSAKMRHYYEANANEKKQRSSEYYNKNRELIAAARKSKRETDHNHRQSEADRAKRYRETNASAQQAKRLAYRQANRDKESERARLWRLANPEKKAANNARRRAAKATQTPFDADQAKIAEFYAMAARLTRITGKHYHVDHIEPLSKGGLHHQDNLVVMTGTLNSSKHDTHWPWLNWFNERSD